MIINTFITSGITNSKVNPTNIKIPDNNKLIVGTPREDSFPNILGAFFRTANPNNIRQPE